MYRYECVWEVGQSTKFILRAMLPFKLWFVGVTIQEMESWAKLKFTDRIG